ncbi:glutathione S-transferase family protein [Sphingobium phenoxybenzoativorans]|jgi:glutathione S-transferase|uniref:Glutathione S-transferase family protein n=2 Tax=Sphingobium TaxID=165695 RepID=A0A4Q1KNR7_9SPHN|nr:MULTISPECIES: glutathione S-transferase family protein [Sphingobium]QUT07600.1 glutathione S-transferase family protein [Sphingobium phenoxybenzoativorans]RXR30869.1 glutathione S-transferase family protein [Sphingobium fluviale]
MYTLHMNPWSFYARRVIALLAQCDLPHDLREVNMMAGEHRSDAFLALNPNGQVPVLVDGDLALAESNAILRYLCNRHGLDDWYPGDPWARAEVDRWLDWTQCRLAPATRDIVFNTVFLREQGNKAEVAKGHETLAGLAPILEERLSKSAHVAGPTPTIADLAVFSCLSQLVLAQARPATPSISAWYDGMGAMKGVAVAEGLMAHAMAT